MKILINTPDISMSGGVANHYKGLEPFWSKNVKYNFIGRRNGVPGPLFLIYDYTKFLCLCLFGNYDIILLNPSLGKTAIIRDVLFLKISKWFKIKTVIFFHGWSPEIKYKLNTNSKNFSLIFNKADIFLVLAKSFKIDLINWGITKPIYLTSTKVNDGLLKRFDFKNKSWDSNILFLTRVETYKGIFITLEAYKIVKARNPKATLTIAGNGSKLAKAKDFVKENKLIDVFFLGNIGGSVLIDVFSKSSIYVLPSYSEGMPTSVLEAMAFGLPVISRPVGGLVDFFIEEKMGFLIESFNPEEYATKILFLLENPLKARDIGNYNHEYAKHNFMASKVTLDIEKLICDV